MQLSSLNMHRFDGLFNCFNFLLPNDYSRSTFGVFAFLLRKTLGELNNSDIMSSIMTTASEQTQDLVKNTIALLNSKRSRLNRNSVSIAKCLIINGLIESIQEDPQAFENAYYDVVRFIQNQMIDHQENQLITYPDDFRERERYFSKSVYSISFRRLNFFDSNEILSPNLIHLQNRTTEHLSYLIDSKLRYEPSFKDTGIEEVKKIFKTTFLIIDQPHDDNNPVIIVDQKNKLSYTAQVNVTIMCLLYDFIQTHPNVITLSEIVPTLEPITNSYRLETPERLFWEVYELNIDPQERPYHVLCAKLSEITIKTESKKEKAIHFIDQFHTLNFRIKFSLNLQESQFFSTFEIPINSLKFKIVSHGSQVSHSIASIILNDIQQFSQCPKIDVNTLSKFLLRYFIHRTGVKTTLDLEQYLIDQLKKALEAKPNCDSLEEVYLDFVFLFVNQIEFMAKNPILCMWYATGFFLGPCDSGKVRECLEKPSIDRQAMVAIRFNSLSPDQASREKTDAQKTKKSPLCSVRIDVYNARTKHFHNGTLDSSKLPFDMLNFISSALEDSTSSIQVLSTIGNDSISATWKPYSDLKKYYHQTLENLHKKTPYLPIINLLIHITNQNTNNIDNTRVFPLNNENEVFQYVLTNPDLLNRIIAQHLNLNTIEPFPMEETTDHPNYWFDEFIP